MTYNVNYYSTVLHAAEKFYLTSDMGYTSCLYASFKLLLILAYVDYAAVRFFLHLTYVCQSIVVDTVAFMFLTFFVDIK